MIFFGNKTEQIASGRSIQKLQSDFLLRTTPSWLTFSSQVSYSNNGIDINGSIETIPVAMDNAEQIKIEIFNLYWGSLPTNPSIKLVSNGKSVGLYGNKFVYNDGSSDVIDENIGMLDGSQVWSWCSAVDLTNYHLGPKNVAIIIQPYYGYYHVLYNGIPVHTRQFSNITFTGDWHWEINTGAKSMHASGIELEIQMNI